MGVDVATTVGVVVSMYAVGDASVIVSVGSGDSVIGTCVDMKVGVGGASVSEGDTTALVTSASKNRLVQPVKIRHTKIAQAAGRLYLMDIDF